MGVEAQEFLTMSSPVYSLKSRWALLLMEWNFVVPIKHTAIYFVVFEFSIYRPLLQSLKTIFFWPIVIYSLSKPTS